MRCPQVRNVDDAPNLSRTESACDGTHCEFNPNLVLADGTRVPAP